MFALVIIAAIAIGCGWLLWWNSWRLLQTIFSGGWRWPSLSLRRPRDRAGSLVCLALCGPLVQRGKKTPGSVEKKNQEKNQKKKNTS